MSSRIVCSVTLFILVTLGHCVDAQEKTVRILTVGNSFADNALTYLPELVAASPSKLIVGRANLGGSTMQRHWNHVEQFEANHDDPAGHPYANEKSSLAELLSKDRWDVVTIQQVSTQSHDLNTYRPYAENLYQYIHQRAPQADILIHQIWAYRVDDDRFTEASDEATPRTQRAMYDQVRQAYHTIAGELNIDILPSGDAMYLADSDPQWGYQPDDSFDFKNASQPMLPLQAHSLHVGWRWQSQDEGADRLTMDGHHASDAGKYLIGCVWFEVLFDQSVVENSFVPPGLDSDYARFLRESAHQAVTNLKRGE